MRRLGDAAALPPGRGPWAYDLWIGDWVAPHGKGIISDIEVAVEFHPIADRDAFDRAFTEAFFFDKERRKERMSGRFPNSTTTSIRFLGEGNGVIAFRRDTAFDQASSFWHPYIAPDHGYSATTSVVRIGRPDLPFSGSSDADEFGLIFRIRTPATSSRRTTARGPTPSMAMLYGATRSPSRESLVQDGAIIGRFRHIPGYSPGSQTVSIWEYSLNPDPLSRSLEYSGVDLTTPEGQRGERSRGGYKP